MTDITKETESWKDCAYLDLYKAFHQFSHNRLLWKFENVGQLNAKIKSWVESYLTVREITTVVKGVMSKWRKADIEIPKGSLLAPTPFLFHTNEYA